MAQPKIDVDQNRRIERLEKHLLNDKENSDLIMLKKEVELIKKSSLSKQGVDESSSKEIQSIDEKIEKSYQQIQSLNKAIKGGVEASLLTGRIKEIENSIEELKSKKIALLKHSSESLFSFEGLLEIDAIQTKSFDKSITSNMDISTLELGVEANLHSNLKANILIEKQSNPANLLEITEAFATYSDTNQHLFHLKAGKMILPFGKLETNLFSDSLGKSLAESHKDALLLGLNWEGFSSSAYLFQSKTKKEKKDDRLRSLGFDLSYELSKENWSFQTSFNYLANYAETDGISSLATLTTPTNILSKEIPGYAFNTHLTYERFSFIFEHITSSKKFLESEISWNNTGAKPSSTQFEFSYTHPFKYQTIFTLGYQATKESLSLALPKNRVLFGFQTSLSERISFGIEHFSDKDYARTDCSAGTCGTDEKAYTTTARLSLTL